MTESKVVRTMCPMNCHPTLCGMQVTVRCENANSEKANTEKTISEKVIAVTGDPDNPDSRGFLCVRGRAAVEIPHNPERLLKTLYRSDRRAAASNVAASNNGNWQELSPSAGLDKLVKQLQSHPPEQFGIWMGHGDAATNYGTRIGGLLARRFAHLYGSQWWHPAMICWGLGGFGLGLTGLGEVHSMDDMADHAELIILWGANLDSQPNTAPRLKRAKKRGAKVVAIDIRQTSATAQADHTLIIKPGTDAALALAMMQVIVRESLHNPEFIEQHTIGFDGFATHLQQFTPQWAADITGIETTLIESVARSYAAQPASMIVLGGSSMHKSVNGWYAGRAVSCLPALTGSVAIPGAGMGPRHGAPSHGQGLQHLQPQQPTRCSDVIPDQMSAITQAMLDGKIKTLLLTGTNMLSSFADSNRLREALSNVPFIVCHELFASETVREAADLVIPATSWVEQMGCKMTHTHIYLMDKAIEPQGDAQALSGLLRSLADRLSIDDFFPWLTDEQMINAVLDHPSTGHVTVAEMRREKNHRAIQPGTGVAHADLSFQTPSGKLEFYSTTAETLGLPPLPVYSAVQRDDRYPLSFRQGRTLTHFHGFYDHGRALPSLARLDSTPQLWMSPADSAQRGIQNNDNIRLFNQRGEFTAQALVTDKILPGTVWMRDGWEGINRLTDGDAVLSDEATRAFAFGVGQAKFDAQIEVEKLSTNNA